MIEAQAMTHRKRQAITVWVITVILVGCALAFALR